MSISGMVHAETAKDAWTDLAGKKLSKRPEFTFVKNSPALPNVYTSLFPPILRAKKWTFRRIKIVLN